MGDFKPSQECSQRHGRCGAVAGGALVLAITTIDRNGCHNHVSCHVRTTRGTFWNSRLRTSTTPASTIHTPQHQQLTRPATMPRCTHKGCGKEYDAASNVDGACAYHPGAPVFHEGLKSWCSSC